MTLIFFGGGYFFYVFLRFPEYKTLLFCIVTVAAILSLFSLKFNESKFFHLMGLDFLYLWISFVFIDAAATLSNCHVITAVKHLAGGAEQEILFRHCRFTFLWGIVFFYTW